MLRTVVNPDVGDLEHLRASTVIVEALSLSREFNGRQVVKDLTLSLEAGVIHGLLGPNGAGKTTVLRMASGLMSPSTGEIRVGGGDPCDRHVRGRIGWVPASDRSFYLRLSGRQNLTFFGQLHGIARSTAKDLADEWIAAVGLEAAGPRPVRLYSHGMVKRLVLARALMCRPDVLVIDEATHDLDPLGADQIRLLVRQAADDGAVVIWATQRIAELPGFADSVTVLDEGSVRFSGSVDDLAAQAGHKSYFLLLEGSIESDNLEFPWGDVGKIGASNRWRMDMMDHVSLTEAFAELSDRGIRVIDCSEERPDVERAFLRLTGPTV
ncbi:MAG TPA: ABC transporter ATP-binding protein [Acidimicrobiia bacterium]|nr:ABC transporter ATP-binding protein [Acidimicrobiia bacterium]